MPSKEQISLDKKIKDLEIKLEKLTTKKNMIKKPVKKSRKKTESDTTKNVKSQAATKSKGAVTLVTKDDVKNVAEYPANNADKPDKPVLPRGVKISGSEALADDLGTGKRRVLPKESITGRVSGKTGVCREGASRAAYC